jgi:hypothetical protein
MHIHWTKLKVENIVNLPFILFPCVAITKYHRQGDLYKAEIHLSQLWKLEVQNQGANRFSLLLSAPKVVPAAVSYRGKVCSHRVLVWWEAEGQEGPKASLIRMSASFTREQLSRPNHLLKAYLLTVSHWAFNFKIWILERSHPHSAPTPSH